MRALQAILSLCFALKMATTGAMPLSTAVAFNTTASPSVDTSTAPAAAAPVAINSTSSAVKIDVNDREPVIDPAFHITIHPTCQGSQALQIERALGELHRLILNSTDLLLQSPASEIVQLYYGPLEKADISTPIGVLHQILYGSKKGVEIRCEDEVKQCKDDKTLQAGGYADKDNAFIHLCKDVFSG
jgi:hypothetical protein